MKVSESVFGGGFLLGSIKIECCQAGQRVGIARDGMEEMEGWLVVLG